MIVKFKYLKGTSRVKMGYHQCTIKVTEETKNRLMNECKEEFLKGHKDFRGMKLSQEFMLRRIIDFYLETP